ncbi:MAG: subclass B3 metallo-beta-lactamase [Acidobacteria bacterium]|nr:subclass B3 metallo-beta-lactamase [Acidobacteriota bacterium]
MMLKQKRANWRPELWLGVVMAGLLAGAPKQGLQAQAPPATDAPAVTIPVGADNENHKKDPIRLIGNIWWVGHSQVGAFLIKSSAGYIMLDTTSTAEAPWVRENLEKLKINPRDIKIMLNSHTHEEHMGGFPMFKELTGGSITMSKAAADEVATGGRTDFREDGSERYKPFKTDKIIEQGGKVTLGDVTLTAHITPGHTKGCTNWTTTVQEDGKTYNVLFFCGMATAGIDRAPLLDNPKYPNIVSDYQQSFKLLRSLPCDVWLYPRATTIRLQEKEERMKKGEKPNPFVDPAGCQWYIDEYEYEFNDQLTQQLRVRAAQRLKESMKK